MLVLMAIETTWIETRRDEKSRVGWVEMRGRRIKEDLPHGFNSPCYQSIDDDRSTARIDSIPNSLYLFDQFSLSSHSLFIQMNDIVRISTMRCVADKTLMTTQTQTKSIKKRKDHHYQSKCINIIHHTVCLYCTSLFCVNHWMNNLLYHHHYHQKQ